MMIEAVGARPAGSLQEVYLQVAQAGGQLPEPPAADRRAFEAAMERAEAPAQVEPSTRADVAAAAADNPWIVPPSVTDAGGAPAVGFSERMMDSLVQVRETLEVQRAHIDSVRANPESLSQVDMLGLLHDVQQATMVYTLVVNEVGQVSSKIDGLLRTA